MNKTDFIKQLAQKTNQSAKTTHQVVNAFWEVITETLNRQESVTFIGQGTFGIKHRPEKSGHHPKTGERLTFAATVLPTFKAGRKLKNAVRQSAQSSS